MIYLQIALVFLAFWMISGYFFFVKSLKNKKRRDYFDIPYLKKRFRKNQLELVEQWFQSLNVEDMDILSFDGLKLHGRYLNHSAETTVILIHGFKSISARLFEIAKHYYEVFEVNVLLVDLRGHGKSDGNYVGLGYLDSLDLRIWIATLLKKQRSIRIILHGVSMGGATVLNLSNQSLPNNVKFIVSDCGFTEAKKVLCHRFTQLTKIPSFPIYYFIAFYYYIFTKYPISKSKPIKRVAESKLPILFIHGDKDDYVPTEMGYQLYKACTSEKELLIVKNAPHTFSYVVEYDNYFNKISDFINRFIN